MAKTSPLLIFGKPLTHDTSPLTQIFFPHHMVSGTRGKLEAMLMLFSWRRSKAPGSLFFLIFCISLSN